MTVAAHPLEPSCARDYWMRGGDMAAAQQAIGAATHELQQILGDALDRLHQERHGVDYWERLIGSFAWQLVCYVFDRVCDPLADMSIPALTADDVCYSGRDFVNRVIERKPLCVLLDAVLAQPSQQMDQALDAACGGFSCGSDLAPAAHGERLSARLRRQLTPWEGSGRVTHYGAPFTQWQAIALALRSGGAIRRAKFSETGRQRRYDPAMRRRLRQLTDRVTDSPTAAVALPIAAWLLPTAFVEQYRALQVEIAPLERSRTRVVATAQGFSRSPAFSLYAARAAERGARIVGLQHGGFYGQMEETWNEIAEHDHCDVFCTWGYRYRAHDVPMPAPRLGKLKRRQTVIKHPQALLWAMCARLFMVHVNASVPHYRRYEELNLRGMDAMRGVLAEQPWELRIRPYPRTRQDPMLTAWSQSLPRTRVDDGNGADLLTHAADCALIIFNFPGATGFLECIRTGTPALIYCPEDIVPVRPEARDIYQRLVEVGLYARTPGELVATLAERQRQGPEWWDMPTRKAARQAFRSHFAWDGDEPLVTIWKRFFLDLAQERPAAQA